MGSAARASIGGCSAMNEGASPLWPSDPIGRARAPNRSTPRVEERIITLRRIHPWGPDPPAVPPPVCCQQPKSGASGIGSRHRPGRRVIRLPSAISHEFCRHAVTGDPALFVYSERIRVPTPDKGRVFHRIRLPEVSFLVTIC
jgi:hypothetical protein